MSNPFEILEQRLIRIEALLQKVTTNAAPATTTAAPEEVLTKAEVRKLFNVSMQTITSWMKSGQLPYKTKGRRVYFIKSEVLASFNKPE